MKLTLTIALSTAGLFLAIAGADAVTVTGSDRMSNVRSQALIPARCVGGRVCRGGYYYRGGIRHCRAWVACN